MLKCKLILATMILLGTYSSCLASDDFDSLFMQLQKNLKVYPEGAESFINENRARFSDPFVECFEYMAQMSIEAAPTSAKRMCDAQPNIPNCLQTMTANSLRGASDWQDMAKVLKGQAKWLETSSGQMWLGAKRRDVERLGEEGYNKMHQNYEQQMAAVLRFPCPWLK